MELKVIAWLFADLSEFLSYANRAKPESTADKPNKRSAKAREEMVLDAITNGATFYAAGKQHGVTPLYPKFLLHRLGKPLPEDSKPVDAARLQLVLDQIIRGLPLAAIARSLNCQYEEVVAVSMAYFAQVEEGRKARLAQRLALARQKIASLLATHEIKTRGDARRLSSTHVQLLYKFDKGWLENVLPACKPFSILRRENRKQVDWNALDSQIAEKLRKAYEAIKSDPLHPRISLAHLSRAIGFRNTWLHRHSHKLPTSSALLTVYAESGPSGRDRRLQAAEKILEADGIASRNMIRNLARTKFSSSNLT